MISLARSMQMRRAINKLAGPFESPNKEDLFHLPPTLIHA